MAKSRPVPRPGGVGTGGYAGPSPYLLGGYETETLDALGNPIPRPGGVGTAPLPRPDGGQPLRDQVMPTSPLGGPVGNLMAPNPTPGPAGAMGNQMGQKPGVMPGAKGPAAGTAVASGLGGPWGGGPGGGRGDEGGGQLAPGGPVSTGLARAPDGGGLGGLLQRSARFKNMQAQQGGAGSAQWKAFKQNQQPGFMAALKRGG